MKVVGIITVVLYALLLFAMLFPWGGVDATYESSDGRWTDSTCVSKGRDFRQVLVYFEMYRMEEGKPDVTLVRVSRRSLWVLLSSDAKWKVPYAPPSGHAQRVLSHSSDLDHGEVRRRADAAWEYWAGQ